MDEDLTTLRDTARLRGQLIGVQVRAARKTAGLSQEQLAQSAGLSVYAVQHLERQGQGDVTDLLALCAVAGVDVVEVVERALGSGSAVRIASPQSSTVGGVTVQSAGNVSVDVGDVDVSVSQA